MFKSGVVSAFKNIQERNFWFAQILERNSSVELWIIVKNKTISKLFCKINTYSSISVYGVHVFRYTRHFHKNVPTLSYWLYVSSVEQCRQVVRSEAELAEYTKERHAGEQRHQKPQMVCT